jgi:hypothetical protein
MTKEEILETILEYYQELNADYEENRNAFGLGDHDTHRAYTKLYAVEELLNRLNLPTND